MKRRTIAAAIVCGLACGLFPLAIAAAGSGPLTLAGYGGSVKMTVADKLDAAKAVASKEVAKAPVKPPERASEPRGKVVALTFDDGPDPRFTPQVLAILREKDVRATFFMVGSQVEKHPELAIRAWVDGHELGNHTYSHPDMKKLSWSDTVGEISKAQDVFVSILGSRPLFFRPPRGEFDSQDFEASKAMGYKMVMWTVGLENHAMSTPQMMVDRVCSKVRNGSVILAHDGNLDRSKSVAALPLLIDKLRAMGYKLVTVSDLLVATGQKQRNSLDIIDYHKAFPFRLVAPSIPLRRLRNPLLYKD